MQLLKPFHTASCYHRIVAVIEYEVKKLENCPKVRNERMDMFMIYISARHETRMLLICFMVIGRFKNLRRKLGWFCGSPLSLVLAPGFSFFKCNIQTVNSMICISQ